MTRDLIQIGKYNFTNNAGMGVGKRVLRVFQKKLSKVPASIIIYIPEDGLI